MAPDGHRADQIAEKLGVTAGHVRKLARETGIALTKNQVPLLAL